MRFKAFFGAAAVLALSGCCAHLETVKDDTAPEGYRVTKIVRDDCPALALGVWGGALALTMASGASGSHTSAPTGTTVP